MFFLQMSGFPGSGKSTLALEIAKRMECIIVDHDVTKSALMQSLENKNNELGKVAYDVDFAYVDYYLSQHKNVILDSPCLYEEMVRK